MDCFLFLTSPPLLNSYADGILSIEMTAQSRRSYRNEAREGADWRVGGRMWIVERRVLLLDLMLLLLVKEANSSSANKYRSKVHCSR